MLEIKKGLFESVIKLARKYYDFGDIGLLDGLHALQEECFGENDITWASELMTSMILRGYTYKDDSLQNFYKVFEAVGTKFID